MNLSYEQIKNMNNIQLEIFKEFISVSEKLGLKYYMVHGSLLGTVIHKGFFPFDDDIDVAMPRRDYDKFVSEGQQHFSSDFFIQSYISEKEYPLPFAKIRNSNTAFIQPMQKKLNINKGIYIDVFPLDFYQENKWILMFKMIKEKILNARISVRYTYPNGNSLVKSAARSISVLLCPSWRFAVKKRADLFSKTKTTNRLITIGGKINEKGIPIEWFGDGVQLPFEGINICCPTMYKEYLEKIYGDYINYNPAEPYMNNDGTVSVSAETISTEKSYSLFN